MMTIPTDTDEKIRLKYRCIEELSASQEYKDWDAFIESLPLTNDGRVFTGREDEMNDLMDKLQAKRATIFPEGM
jgi:lipase chaperone LimK